VISGRDALRASEARVARVAADGIANKQIAQALFVTYKTVDTHLYRACRPTPRRSISATACW
jgi:DNA-binding CsgD family transcriptional regulator